MREYFTKRGVLNFKNIVLLLAMLFMSQNYFAVAEINISIEMPVLGEGMSELETIMASNVGLAVSGIDLMIGDLLSKPKLTAAYGNATGLSHTLPILGSLPGNSDYSFTIGGYGGIFSDTFNIKILSEQFDTLNPEDDFSFGIGPNMLNNSITFPLDFILPGFSLFGSFGYVDFSNSDFFVRNISGILSLSYTILKDRNVEDFFKWSPLLVQAGISYGVSSLGVSMPAGLITEDFGIDPDGDGPLIPLSVTIEIDPVIEIGLEAQTGTFNLTLSTIISVFNFVHAYAGLGLNYTYGSTALTLFSYEDIVVKGYLENLIQEKGKITIGGTVEGVSPNGLLPFLFSGLQFDISNFFISIPILYHPVNGLGAGLSAGVSL
jgi:hypothetical protein